MESRYEFKKECCGRFRLGVEDVTVVLLGKRSTRSDAGYIKEPLYRTRFECFAQRFPKRRFPIAVECQKAAKYRVKLLRFYYSVRRRNWKTHVVDSKGKFSEQIDIVVVDRQYSPYIFRFKGQTVVLAESVYAAFEAKQTLNANQVRYAQKKVASVRKLHRTM